MKEINGSKVSILFSFPRDKISKEQRAELAQTFAEILGVSVLVCDKDCEIAIINYTEEKQDER